MKKVIGFSCLALCIVLIILAIGLASCSKHDNTGQNESTNESTNESMNESTNESTNESMNESSNESSNESATGTESEQDYEVTKEPTCLENGFRTYTDENGETYDEEIPALGHDYKEKVVKPTDNAKGYTEHTCTRCGDTYRDNYVDSLKQDSTHKHNYTVKVTKEVTCLVAGEKTYTCECGDTYTEEVPVIGHEYKTSKVDATCLDRGYTLNECKNCDYEYKSNYVNALGHNFSNWKSMGDSEHQGTCTRCKVTKTEAHKTSAKVTKEATCKENGTKTHTCDACGYSYTETIAATGKHNYKDKVVKPTENTGGYTEHTCTVCGDSYRDNYTDPTGSKTHTHSWEEKTTKEPTCESTGTITHTCKTCGEHWDEEIKALGHDYKSTVTAPTCTEQGYTTWKCSRCSSTYKDTYKDATGHSYDNGKMTTPVTCTNDGVKTYTCSKCRHTYTEKVSATGHSYTLTVTKPTCTEQGYTTHRCNKCGDTFKDSIVQPTGHKNTEIRDKKNATCTAEGYTGDTYCLDCKAKIKTGNSIPKIDHVKEVRNKKEATCTSEGYTGDEYCKVCQTKLSTGQKINKKPHTEEVRNKREATCTTEGYTGDTYCKVCQTKLKTGQKIGKTAHSWTFKKTTKEGTCTETSKELYECSVCQTTETRDGAKNPNNHDWQCTKQAWDEEEPVMATLKVWYGTVDYYPYPKTDPRRFDPNNLIHEVYYAWYNYYEGVLIEVDGEFYEIPEKFWGMDYYHEQYAAWQARIAEVSQWEKDGKATFVGRAYGDTYKEYQIATKKVHHDGEYTCSRCGQKTTNITNTNADRVMDVPVSEQSQNQVCGTVLCADYYDKRLRFTA